MKSQDLLVIGGIGLIAFMLSKPKLAEAKGDITTIIPMPSADTGLDIAGLVTGILTNIPETIINIPETIVNIPETILNIPETFGEEDFIKWWEKTQKATTETLSSEDIEDMIDKAVTPFLELLETGNGEGLIPDIPDLIPDIPDLIPDIPKEVYEYTQKPFLDIMGGIFGDYAEGVTDKIINRTAWILGKPSPYTEWLEVQAESEAIFREAGVTEATPDNLSLLIAAREKVTGEKAEVLPPIGSEDYWQRMLGYRSIK